MFASFWSFPVTSDIWTKTLVSSAQARRCPRSKLTNYEIVTCFRLNTTNSKHLLTSSSARTLRNGQPATRLPVGVCFRHVVCKTQTYGCVLNTHQHNHLVLRTNNYTNNISKGTMLQFSQPAVRSAGHSPCCPSFADINIPTMTGTCRRHELLFFQICAPPMFTKLSGLLFVTREEIWTLKPVDEMSSS